jgi:hypothetical protein
MINFLDFVSTLSCCTTTDQTELEDEAVPVGGSMDFEYIN